jgi:protein-disulfide isomerase
VNGFLTTNWGYDDNRVWQVQAITKTQVEGLSKVVIYVADKSGKGKPGAVAFFVLPGDKFLIAGDEVIPFGEHPFAENRAALKERADGPYRGSADKNLELVEFADFQCPHCKEAQANMEKLATDFPSARFVFQNYPLPQHAEAAHAAAYGVCVAKQGGSTAFYAYASAVFEGQDGLSTPDGATLTLNSAVTKAGLDPAKIETCAKDPATVKSVQDSVKLAQDLNINQTPTLEVNGRAVPANAPYETLKKIVEFQEKLDGVTQ